MLSNNIKTLRIAKGLSQEELAEPAKDNIVFPAFVLLFSHFGKFLCLLILRNMVY